jgi:outer membrane protein OmpA-like peptidoglycan-associated protein
MHNWIMHNLWSIPAGLLTIGVANVALVAGCWWWSRGKGVGLWLRRSTAILLALVGVAGGTVTYRVAYLRQEAAEKKEAELRKDIAGLKTELTNALAVNRVQEVKLATLERSASEQRQLDAERAAALEADLKKAMEDIGAMFNERNGVIELVLKDAIVNFDTDLSTLQCDGKERLSRVVGAISRVLDGVDSITIVGHTDMRGTADHNKQLSKERADAVLKYLASSGIPRKMMTGIGKSYLQPAGFDSEQSMAVIKKANDSVKAMAENRRVQLLIRRKALTP